MLEAIATNFNTELNDLTGIKTESGIIKKNLKNSQKLLRIFTFITLKSLGLENQQYRKVKRKELKVRNIFYYLLERLYVLIVG